jgi:hypothetical protein
VLEGDWCEVLLVHKHRRLVPIVAVAITPAGAVFLNERPYAVGVDTLVTEAGNESADGRYPPIEQFLSARQGTVIALSSPTDPLPPGKFGYYSDGAQHIEVVGVSPDGKRLFKEVNGDTVSTNILGYVDSLNFG